MRNRKNLGGVCVGNVPVLSLRLIDCFLAESPVSSLTFSPTGDFLATAHVDDLGIYLWSNKTIDSHVSLRPLPPDFVPSTADLPPTGLPEGAGDEEEGEGEGEEGREESGGVLVYRDVHVVVCILCW